MNTDTVVMTNRQEHGQSNESLMIEDLGEFHMKEPLFFDVERGNGWVYLSMDGVNLHGYGADMQSAREELYCVLDFVWDKYVECSEDDLHWSSLPLRRWLMEHVEKVE